MRGWLCRRRLAGVKAKPPERPAPPAVFSPPAPERPATPENRHPALASLRDELRDLRTLPELKGQLREAPEAQPELQELRVRAVQAEAELEQSQKHLQSLQEELTRRDGRGGSLDQLRNELLARIDSSAQPTSSRPSIVLNEDGRKSILNQRERLGGETGCKRVENNETCMKTCMTSMIIHIKPL